MQHGLFFSRCFVDTTAAAAAAAAAAAFGTFFQPFISNPLNPMMMTQNVPALKKCNNLMGSESWVQSADSRFFNFFVVNKSS